MYFYSILIVILYFSSTVSEEEGEEDVGGGEEEGEGYVDDPVEAWLAAPERSSHCKEEQDQLKQKKRKTNYKKNKVETILHTISHIQIPRRLWILIALHTPASPILCKSLRRIISHTKTNQNHLFYPKYSILFTTPPTSYTHSPTLPFLVKIEHLMR